MGWRGNGRVGVGGGIGGCRWKGEGERGGMLEGGMYVGGMRRIGCA